MLILEAKEKRLSTLRVINQSRATDGRVSNTSGGHRLKGRMGLPGT